jgi:hypothetical protein
VLYRFNTLASPVRSCNDFSGTEDIEITISF